MAEQDNEQAGEALLQNARRTLREQPRRAIAGLCVVLLLGLLTAALASSLQRVSADDVCADAVAGAVKPMALSGSYAVDGGEERPYAARQALDAKGIGVEAVTVRGTLENDVAAGELVNMRLSSTACTVRVNGETVFSFDGIGDSEPAGEPLLGWIGFRSPGISTRDEVEIALSSAASYSVLGDYVIVLDSLCTGEPDALFVASVASHLPMFVSGILVLIAGLILLLIASVGYLIGVPKETGGLRFAFYVLIGGVWIFFCFDYITLLIPFPAFTTTVSLLAQDVLALLQLSFIASRATGYPRRLATLLLAALSLMLGVCIVLRLAGVASLYEANVVIIPLFVIGVFFAALALAVEARESRDRMAVDATLVVIPCTIGSVVEGLSFLFGGVTTGLWLCAGILCAVVVHFVALFSYARSQIVQAERAHRMEAELLQSRIAVMLSQIQPHFLFNALNTIEYLCEEDPPVAARATNDFARYLRGNMDSLMGSQTVSFRNELEHLAHYVAIEQLRYPSIKVEYDVRADDFLVPSLSVQPLVENAIKHGASRRAGEGVVKVSSWREGRSFVVRVTDNGPGFDERSIARFKEGVDVGIPDNRPPGEAPARNHVGLANVAARVAATCGGTMRVENEAGGGASVTMTVPCEEEGGSR